MNRETFDEALVSPEAAERLERLQSQGAFRLVFPEVQAMVGFGGRDTGHKDLWGHTKQVVAQCIQSSAVRWAALFHDVGKVKCFTRDANGEIAFHGHEAVSAKMFKQASRRTNFFTKDEVDGIHFLIYHLGRVEEYDNSWTDSAVRRLYNHTKEHFNDIVALARADITTKHRNKRLAHYERMKELRERAHKLAEIDAIPQALPKGLGNAISAEFGISPSPALGEIMKSLKAAVEKGDLERQASIKTLLEFIKSHPERFGVSR